MVFVIAFNLNENWCSNIYMGLNQGAITVMMGKLSYRFNLESIYERQRYKTDENEGLSSLSQENCIRKIYHKKQYDEKKK